MHEITRTGSNFFFYQSFFPFISVFQNFVHIHLIKRLNSITFLKRTSIHNGTTKIKYIMKKLSIYVSLTIWFTLKTNNTRQRQQFGVTQIKNSKSSYWSIHFCCCFLYLNNRYLCLMCYQIVQDFPVRKKKYIWFLLKKREKKKKQSLSLCQQNILYIFLVWRADRISALFILIKQALNVRFHFIHFCLSLKTRANDNLLIILYLLSFHFFFSFTNQRRLLTSHTRV